jgi:hypothetical protein
MVAPFAPRRSWIRRACHTAFQKGILAPMPSEVPARHLERIAVAPALIVGAPRSGTTRLQRLLLADPRCAGGQESHFFASFGGALRDFDRKRAMSRPHGLAAYWHREELVTELRGLWVRMASRVLELRPEALLLVEKTPDHALWLDVVREVLPDARVIHAVRDSRAVVASLLAAGRTAWGADWAPKSLAAAIAVWRRHVEAVLAHAPDAPVVHHERLAAEPVGSLATLFANLELPIESGDLAALVAREPTVRFAAAGAIGEPPAEPEGFDRRHAAGDDGAGARARWRRELGLLASRRVWRETAALMERLGYREDGTVVGP